MQYEVVKRRPNRLKRSTKRRIKVLIFSIFVALVVVGIGVFGTSQISKNRTGKKKPKDSNEIIHNTEQDTDNNENESSKDLNSAGDNSEDQQETTTEEETTSEPVEEFTIDPEKPMVALTFDDGPDSQNTDIILDALKENGAHATFFVVGYNVDGHEDILKRIVEAGSEVGSHTMTHSKLTALDDNGLNYEINDMRNKIAGITGQETVIIRPPYGAVDDNVMAHINDPVILWSIDTEDWKTRNVEMTIQNIQNTVFDGAIILMHDIHDESAQAAVQIIPWLKEQGYQMVTISELGYYRRGGLQLGIRYGSLPPN